MHSRQLIVWRGSRAARRTLVFVREGHPQRVRELARRLGLAVGLSSTDLAALEQAALLHDLGRSLLPPGADEQQHVRVGAELLRGQVLPPGTLDAVLHHHERWDGRGYPHGLRGVQIPKLARLLAVANAADHLGRLPREAQLQRLAEGRGHSLDPELVNACLRLLERSERTG